MKQMTCNQLGGACDHIFEAETFQEIAAQSKQHAMEMFQKGDQPHIQAMQEMQKNMQSPADMQAWMEEKQRLFESL